jgi:hypothetical protein
MYRFLFYFIYKGQLKDNKGAQGPSRTVACMFVTLAIVFQLALFYSIIKFLYWNYKHEVVNFSMGDTYSVKMLVTGFCMLPIFIAVFRYYNLDKIQRISEYYEERKQKTYSTVNFMKFFSIYLIPLLIFIYLINHSIPIDF